MKTISLSPGAFNQELLNVIGTNKVGWNGEDHGELVAALLTRLTDQNNKPLELGVERSNVINLVFRPTSELQSTVLAETFAAAGYEMDASVQSTFALLYNAAQFGEYLQKKENPKTKKPFIGKAPNRAKKKTFDALMAETVAEPATAAVDAVQPATKDEATPQPAREGTKGSEAKE